MSFLAVTTFFFISRMGDFRGNPYIGGMNSQTRNCSGCRAVCSGSVKVDFRG